MAVKLVKEARLSDPIKAGSEFIFKRAILDSMFEPNCNSGRYHCTGLKANRLLGLEAGAVKPFGRL